MEKILYEVKFKPYEDTQYTYSAYTEKYSDAKKMADEYCGFKAKAIRKKLVMTYSHSALALGYLGKNKGHIQKYNGRFGEGVKVHIPTNESNVRGNRYHLIEYYILT